MTTILEKCISVIAPHDCILCGNQNNVICDDCSIHLRSHVLLRCFGCGLSVTASALCRRCSNGRIASGMWVAANYHGLAEQAIKKLKFERAAAVAKPLARAIAGVLPELPAETLIVPVPTATSRIRMRGYDHCLLLAKELSKTTGLSYATPLIRVHNKRQVGASRQLRAQQAAGAFALPSPQAVAGRRILLLDDVITTGATVRAAMAVLRKAGAIQVDVAAAAHQPASSGHTN